MDCDDSINNPLLYLDPLCSALNMLADVASRLHYQDTTSSIHSLRIRFNKKTMKIVKEGANDGFDEVSNSKKPIKFMASSFAASSSLKFHRHLKKTITNNADEVLIKDDNLPSTSKNPINFMCSAIEEGATSNAELNYNVDDEDLLIKEKKKRALKGKSAAIINDAENGDVLDQDWVPFQPPQSASSSSKKRQRFNVVVEAAPSELPQEFIDKINEMGGNETTLLITKSLFDSDLNEQQNRLSIPSKQIENVNFLREGELEDLEGGKCIERHHDSGSSGGKGRRGLFLRSWLNFGWKRMLRMEEDVEDFGLR
ncbi:hypothetical protein TanjilG_11991 [Lupinus angustifolius]|nr:hypothetical protein TanjilG_11991 [Lupinus angustifolius]